METNKKKLVTHDGSFHADDIFACATLCMVLEKEGQEFEIIRTRDIDIIKDGDYVFDVGGIYNENTNRFDHHQKGGAGKRENDIEYASFGLVWKHFGMKLCDDDIAVWNIIDSKIAIPIDAVDNGMDIAIPKYNGVLPYYGDQPFLIFSPTWQEDESNTNKIFKNEVNNAVRILKREITVAKADVLGRKIIIEAYNKSVNKEIITLENNFPRYLYQNTLSTFPEPIYVIYPGRDNDHFKVEAIKKSFDTIESRKLFPEAWRGFLNSDINLAKITGVFDALFSHRAGFLITVKTKEGAIKLAELALNFSLKTP